VFVAQGNLTNSFSKAWQGLTFTGQGRIYGVNRKFYYCSPDENCVGGLNTIPTFARD
jgi:hypothetical protein